MLPGASPLLLYLSLSGAWSSRLGVDQDLIALVLCAPLCFVRMVVGEHGDLPLRVFFLARVLFLCTPTALSERRVSDKPSSSALSRVLGGEGRGAGGQGGRLGGSRLAVLGDLRQGRRK